MVGVPLELAVGFDDIVASVAGQLAVVQSWITTAYESGRDGGLDHRDHMLASLPTVDLKISWVTEESENERRRWEWRQESGGFSLAQTSAISATSEEPSFAGEVTGSPEPHPSTGSVRVSNGRNHRRARHLNLTAERRRR